MVSVTTDCSFQLCKSTPAHDTEPFERRVLVFDLQAEWWPGAHEEHRQITQEKYQDCGG